MVFVCIASCVISDRTIKYKKGFLSELNRPLFVIENPELTNTLPFYQVGCGIVDIIAHTLERYFNKSQELEFADYMAEGLLKSVIDATNILLKDYYNYCLFLQLNLVVVVLLYRLVKTYKK